HAVSSGIMGYFVGRGRLAKDTSFVWIACGLVCGVFIHGLYDWDVMSGGGFGFFTGNPWLGLAGVVPILAAFGMVLRALVKHALALVGGDPVAQRNVGLLRALMQEQLQHPRIVTYPRVPLSTINRAIAMVGRGLGHRHGEILLALHDDRVEDLAGSAVLFTD